MPIARVQSPDGRIARFEVPDGATPEQIEAFAAQTFGGGENTPSQADQGGAEEQASGGLTQEVKDVAKGLYSGLEQGLTFGGADELKAALAAGLVQGAGLVNPSQDLSCRFGLHQQAARRCFSKPVRPVPSCRDSRALGGR